MNDKTDASPANTTTHARKKVLIRPALQLRLIATFFSISCLAVLAEALVINVSLRGLAAELPHDGDVLLHDLPGLLLRNLLLTFALLGPLTVAIGVLVTFRIYGPVHRFESWLRARIQGQNPGPCRIRGRDEFQELCALLNHAAASECADASNAPGVEDEAESRPAFSRAS